MTPARPRFSIVALGWLVLWALLALAWFGVFLTLRPSPALPQGLGGTQCIVNVAAQGSADAITSVALPCGTTTNMVLLTASAANTTTTPTYQPLGSPAWVITRASGVPLSPGDLTAGYVALLTSTGTSWVLLNPANVISLTVPVSIANGGTAATSQTGALANLLGASTIPTANGGTAATGTIAAKKNLRVAGVSVVDYGAKCDGVSDDTSAFNAAVTAVGAGGGGMITVPSQATFGKCVIAGTVLVNQSGVHLVGEGAKATYVVCSGTAAIDCFRVGSFPNEANCTAGAMPPACSKLTSADISDMTIDASSRLGAAALSVVGDYIARFSGLYVDGWSALYVSFFNGLYINDSVFNCNATSGPCVIATQSVLAASATYWRADVLSMVNVVVQAREKGADCFRWDGPVYTVNLLHTHLLGCYDGMHVYNTANSNAYYPQFLTADDLEVDGTGCSAVNAEVFYEFAFVNSMIDSNKSTNVGCITFKATTQTAALSKYLQISNTFASDARAQNLYIEGKMINISNSRFFYGSLAANNTYPECEIGGGAATDQVLISNTLCGEATAEGSQTPQYGVQVDAGVGSVSLSNNSYRRAATAAVNNLSSNTIGVWGGIGPSGAAFTITTCAAGTAC